MLPKCVGSRKKKIIIEFLSKYKKMFHVKKNDQSQ